MMDYTLLFKVGVLDRVRGKSVDISKFSLLEKDFGKDLIIDWYEKGIKQFGCSPEESFEPFIYLWIAFNAWSTCVTSEDGDSHQREILAYDLKLQEVFKKVFESRDGKKNANLLIKTFFEQLPIFSVKSIIKKNLTHFGDLESQETRIAYYYKKKILFEPRDAETLLNEGSEIPVDWPHMLCAIAQVRNNLFHGNKSRVSQRDKTVVHAAFQALAVFLIEAELIVRKSDLGV